MVSQAVQFRFTLSFNKSRVIPRYCWIGPREILSGASCPNSSSIIPMNSSRASSFSCEMFKSSMCHATVSCHPSTILFTTQLSYRFGLKPNSFTNFACNFSQNSRAAQRVPYSALSSSTYITIFLLSTDT